MNPVDPISGLHDQFFSDLALAREATRRRVGDLWAFADHNTVFLWTLGVPTGPFVLPEAWQSALRSYEVGEGEAGGVIPLSFLAV